MIKRRQRIEFFNYYTETDHFDSEKIAAIPSGKLQLGDQQILLS